MNTFINKNGIIVVTNVRKVQNVANIYGYIRVSTKDQNEQRQLHKMMERGVEARRIFVDKASGRYFDRPQYQLLRKILSTGDIVYIDALDRMGRNYDEVISEWKINFYLCYPTLRIKSVKKFISDKPKGLR